MRKTFHFIDEPSPGDAWRERFLESWPHVKRWYLEDGESARPSRAACAAALYRHMPELKSMWHHLCRLAGGGDLQCRLLSGWSPPNVFGGCSVAVTDIQGPALIRNYDFDPGATGDAIVRSRWSQRSVIGVNEGGWGLLDGMNDAGLVACLTFGGRPVCGKAFSVVLVLRYILETCATAAEAADRLRRLKTHLAQNVVVLDASGAHFTALMGPDRPTRIWETRVTTNHPEVVEWPEHAASSRTVERYDFLRARLGSPRLAGRFLDAPLYGTGYDGGLGTVYTAIYRPREGKAVFCWPHLEVEQSFSSFVPRDISVRYEPGKPATATV